MKIFGTIFRFMGLLLSAVLLAGAGLLLFATVPQLGNQSLIVRSGSMKPAIKVGDLVVVRPREGGYEEGEVIAYHSPNDEKVTITHRIMERFPTTTGFEYLTKGDANEEPDAYRVQEAQVIGRQLMVVPYVGRALALGKTRTGFIGLVVVPAGLIIIGDILTIWREVRKRRRVKRLALGRVVEDTDEEEMDEAVQAEEMAAQRKEELRKEYNRPKIRVDSLTRKLAVLAMAVSVTIPISLAMYADSEESAGNVFQAAACGAVPTVPNLFDPADGLVVTAGSEWDLKPVMDWSSSFSACSGGTVKYQYQSARNADFSPVAFTSGWLVDSEIPAPNTPNGHYWWHVRASSDDGATFSDWSETWELIVDRSN